jgi:hypothetical protein
MLNEGSTYKDFLLTKDIKSKQSEAYGKIVARHIVNTGFGVNGYVNARNARCALNRKWFTGRIDVKAMFADKINFNGKFNYLNLNWKALSIVNTIVSRMVGRWMTRTEKINVTATDPLSLKQKDKEYAEIQFELDNRRALAELEQSAGIPLVPKDQFRPEDAQELELWRAELQRTPEEILYETNCNDSLEANGWQDTLKEQALIEAAVTGFVGTYTCMDEEGVIHTELIPLENALYTYSNYPDFRDTSMRGRVKSLKISEIRRQYGAEFGGKLTEEKIFELVQYAKEYQNFDKISWLNEWNWSWMRPYDEWNLDVVEFEVKTVDSEAYTINKTSLTGSTHVYKGLPKTRSGNPRDKLPTEEIIKDEKWNIYRGVYIKVADCLLEWGIKKNMIRPQDPKESGDCEFSYSFYMYQNYEMRNLAIPEKIEEPVEQMLLTRLKMQQLVAKMRPPGAMINEDALNEIDYGLGDDNKSVDTKKHFDQTGDIYYRGRDAQGNPIPVPITELNNAGFLPQMQALIQLYEYHYKILKDELGEDPNLMSQAATPRVTSSNIQTSLQQGDYATGYVYDAFIHVMEDMAKKMACLMHKSVLYGARAYRNIMGAAQVERRVFGTKIKMLPQEYELQQLQALLNQAIASTPDLVLYLDVFKVMRLARENIKLGEQYLTLATRKMIKSKQNRPVKMRRKMQKYKWLLHNRRQKAI